LANLVRNAVQALDGAGVPDAEVRVAASRDEPGRVTILVTDNGPGLPGLNRAARPTCHVRLACSQRREACLQRRAKVSPLTCAWSSLAMRSASS
ncbi:ATP-binding protein, partial [Methylobacterium sp. J-072]|uniref:ATP-binding protein n=1 Tax=Methylobacterium sp. J-072 TaxID=2836651 RepID=UPI00391AAB61